MKGTTTTVTTTAQDAVTTTTKVVKQRTKKGVETATVEQTDAEKLAAYTAQWVELEAQTKQIDAQKAILVAAAEVVATRVRAELFGEKSTLSFGLVRVGWTRTTKNSLVLDAAKFNIERLAAKYPQCCDMVPNLKKIEGISLDKVHKGIIAGLGVTVVENMSIKFGIKNK